MACIVIIILTILGVTNDFGSFFHASGVLLVFGGTLASAFMGYEFRYVMQSLGAVGGLFIRGKANRQMLTVETGKIIRWGYLVPKPTKVQLEEILKAFDRADPCWVEKYQKAFAQPDETTKEVVPHAR